jgi:hypothetical protein
VTRVVNQNRPASVNASPAASRHAALKGLDPPALARIASKGGRLFWVVKVLKRSALFATQNRHSHNRSALWVRHSLHQNASKTACFLVLAPLAGEVAREARRRGAATIHRAVGKKSTPSALRAPPPLCGARTKPRGRSRACSHAPLRHNHQFLPMVAKSCI